MKAAIAGMWLFENLDRKRCSRRIDTEMGYNCADAIRSFRKARLRPQIVSGSGRRSGAGADATRLGQQSARALSRPGRPSVGQELREIPDLQCRHLSALRRDEMGGG